MLRSVKKNEAKGLLDIALFETGNVFNLPFDENSQPKENCNLAVVLAGTIDSRPNGELRKVDVFDAVDIVSIISNALRLSKPEMRDVDHSSGFHPTRCSDIFVDGIKIGIVGELLDSDGAVGLEINLETLFSCEEKDSQYRPTSNLPFVAFDLAFVVPKDTPVAQVERSLRIHGSAQLEDVSCFDLFEGSGIDSNEKSLTFSVRARPTASTWTEDDQAQFRRKLIDGVSRDCKARLRS